MHQQKTEENGEVRHDDEDAYSLLNRIKTAIADINGICTGFPPDLAETYREKLLLSAKHAEKYCNNGNLRVLKSLLYDEIPRLANAAETERERPVILKKRIEKLIIRYNTLYSQIDDGKEQYPRPFSMENYLFTEDYAEKMESQIQKLQDDIIKKQEQAYIQETIDRVLRGMNYQIIGGRDCSEKEKKDKPELFRSNLYRFGQSSAVKASFSTNGEISMEIVGLSESERTPSGSEVAVLCRDMKDFCMKFSEFKKNLERMGVHPKLIYEYPPEKKYARIDNINEYKLNNNVSRESLLIDRTDIYYTGSGEQKKRYSEN